MIDHPFLSFKDLNDEELLEKTSQLYKNLNRANMFGSSIEAIEQIQWMIEMIEEEKMERLQKQQFEALNNMFPNTVESDPSFKDTSTDQSVEQVSKPSRKVQELQMPVFNKEYINKDKK